MKHKNNIIIFALLLLSMSASAQIQFTAGLNYESGVPSGAPSSTGSRIRVNLATGRAYIWNQAGTNWRVLAQGIDIVAGCSAPLYTPGYGQSLFAVNGCASPELYYYTGTAWVQISGAGGATYYAGEGIDITNDTISIDTVQRLSFRTDQTYSDGIGTLSWDDTDGTLQLGLKGGNVSLQVGQESVQLVKHADNTGLTNGKVVYMTGSSGGNLTVRYAQANNESTSANTFGLMTESATGGNKAFCTTFGLVRNINTSNLTEGGMVWLSKDTAGAMTAVRPTAPNNGVEIGFCVTKHATNGVIFVTVQNGYELDELHNVYVPSPTNGQVLTYDATDSRWEAATVADQSATNELQTIDTFSLSGQTLSASLSSDAQAAKTVTLPIIDVVAGTNVTVTKSNGVATVSATGGGGSGTVTGTGVAGRAAFWRSTSAISSDANFAWDSTNVRLNIGNPSSPTGRLNIKGSGSSNTTANLRLTNSGNTQIFSVADDGTTSVGSKIVLSDSYITLNHGSNNNITKIYPNPTQPNNFPNITFYPAASAADIGQGVSIVPKGNGFAPTLRASITVFNTDLIADGTNYEFFQFRAAGTSFFAGSGANASGVVRPVLFATGSNSNQMWLLSSGRVSFNSATSASQVQINGSSTSSTDYSLIVTNSGGSTTTPAICAQNNQKVGIGTNSVDSGATLEVDGTTGGILFPRLSTTNRDALTPTNGLVIYNTTTSKFQGYAGGAWVDLH